jgi:dihydroorotate dehydrogenase
MSALDRIGQKLLFTLDPETAHGLSIASLRCGLPVAGRSPREKRLKVSVCGIDFPNPLGMAAGYDKNAEVPDALLNLGFGFAEVGTVTPLPQAGNPKPRIFRLTSDEAVINRLGFNNEGHDAAERRLAARRGRAGIVGVNIGANKDSADRIGDYERGVIRFAPYATYLTVNISSPNTPGLRNMQARGQLGELLSRVIAARAAASAKPPIFLKIAPDLVEAELEDIAAEVIEKAIDGIIVSNTTIARPPLRSAGFATETGGLSGKPLFERSTIVLAKMRKLLGQDRAIAGVGGVDSTETALEKIRAGADLVQLYTGMIYAGPSLPGRVVAGMLRFAEREGLASVSELRDSRLDYWATKPL